MKQMLKGIDILLYSGSTCEIVENVLVGNPTSSGTNVLTQNGGAMQCYTLAIPKGDNHDWVNRTVGLFGKKFRTVGIPCKGIEENIPLFWHKQVNVQMLDISGDCTIYEKDTYTRHVFTDVYYYDNRGTVTLIDGISTSGGMAVQIYADKFKENSYKPKSGDIIVLDNVDFEFDTTSQQTVSQSMAEFRQTNDYAVVSEVKSVSYGEIPDYIITAL